AASRTPPNGDAASRLALAGSGAEPDVIADHGSAAPGASAGAGAVGAEVGVEGTRSGAAGARVAPHGDGAGVAGGGVGAAVGAEKAESRCGWAAGAGAESGAPTRPTGTDWPNPPTGVAGAGGRTGPADPGTAGRGGAAGGRELVRVGTTGVGDGGRIATRSAVSCTGVSRPVSSRPRMPPEAAGGRTTDGCDGWSVGPVVSRSARRDGGGVAGAAGRGAAGGCHPPAAGAGAGAGEPDCAARSAAAAASRSRISRRVSGRTGCMLLPLSLIVLSSIQTVLGDVLDHAVRNQVPHRLARLRTPTDVRRRDGEGRDLERGDHARRQTFDAQVVTRAGDSHEVCHLPQLVGILPGQDLLDSVRTRDEEQLGV